jgi:hypothetical protein
VTLFSVCTGGVCACWSAPSAHFVAQARRGQPWTYTPKWEDLDEDDDVFDMTPAERGRLDGDEHWERIRKEKGEMIQQLGEEDEEEEGGVPGGEINKREQGYKAREWSVCCG